MKIGILTFHKTDNYGAMLQMYCLYSFLKIAGYDVQLIDHDLARNTHKECGPIWKKMKRFIVRTVTFLRRKKRKRVFEEFLDRFELTKSWNHFDLVVVGSDQVWNLRLTNKDLFFLGKGISCKLVSYAASCGNVSSVSDDERMLYQKYLPAFSAISVREESALRFLNPILNCEVKKTLDPTLLVNREILEKIRINVKRPPKFILAYDCLSPSVNLFVKKIARQLNAEIVYLSLSVKTCKKRYDYQAASVGEFLGYFAAAECVVTTSFHGCAISIAYQRNFYALNFNSEMCSRSRELLESLGLERRFVDVDEDINYTPVDYTESNRKLEILREQSRAFLLGAI